MVLIHLSYNDDDKKELSEILMALSKVVPAYKLQPGRQKRKYNYLYLKPPDYKKRKREEKKKESKA